MSLKINVLGTEYAVNFYNYDDVPEFKKRSIDGFCDSVEKEIAICRIKTYPGFEDKSEEYCRKLEKQVLRHEIVHAFFNESGLQDSSLQIEGGWAKNEEMVDWIALQFPKMMQAMKEAECLEG